MAKFFNRSTVTVTTYCAEGVSYDVPADDEYHVRALGRGRWSVEYEDGYRRVLRTAALQRFFRPRSYECGYHSSGEPMRVYEEVDITRA